MQRGFLKGRQILHNVLDIDHASHTLSIISQQAALLLFDFRAAFPFVSHDIFILWILLKIAGTPAPFIKLVRSLPGSPEAVQKQDLFSQLAHEQVLICICTDQAHKFSCGHITSTIWME